MVLMKYNYLYEIFSLSLFAAIIHAYGNYNNCDNDIYAKCTHPTSFTEEEIDTARIYIQNRFMNEADYKPVKPPCKKLQVRKNFKCLTEKERMDLLTVIRELYRRGVIEHLAQIHSEYWPGIHKTIQFGVWHRKFSLELEKQMQRLNPDLTFPYWQYSTDFAKPEKSIIWKYFGTTGNFSTGYCVRDGMFANLTILKCVRRQWRDGYWMPPYTDPLIETIYIQSETLKLYGAHLYGFHFVPHLSIGGWYGDHSITYAPNDFVFHLWHNYFDLMDMKRQLRNSRNLTPREFNTLQAVDPMTGELVNASIFGKILYFNTSILEAYQFTFGEYCYIHADLIKPINELAKGLKNPIPTAVKRMPKYIKDKYIPGLNAHNLSVLDHTFVEVGDCNRQCKPMPVFERYKDTQNGRRNLVRLRYDLGIDLGPQVEYSEPKFINVISELNELGYCSPYVS